MIWRVHEYEREQYEVWEYDEQDRRTGAVLYCGHSEVGKLLAERIAKLSAEAAIVDKLPELEATVADLMKALAGLIEIDGCDGRGDPARTATDDLREQAWANAYAVIAKAKGEELPP